MPVVRLKVFLPAWQAQFNGHLLSSRSIQAPDCACPFAASAKVCASIVHVKHESWNGGTRVDALSSASFPAQPARAADARRGLAQKVKKLT
ncbi:MAG TPA: hypothetical protein VJP80_01485 [Candidatus Saccharimonadales bacterium]|nr:hypothetical protein [Candidatus Saccharimonadales bacterium]